MSTQDLRGQHARVDRSTSVSEASGRRVSAYTWWLTPLLLVSLFSGVEPGSRPDHVDPSGAEPVELVVGAELPLHLNARVEAWMERFQTTHRPEFARILGRSGAYDTLIRSKLRERGMPEELLYLAMMESGLSAWAVSPVSAVGVWQFMAGTAMEYGLRVDEYVDERRDPVRATDAALDYLDGLHTRFDSWYLAAAAYNAGPNRVQGVLIAHAGGRTGDEDLYWEVLEHLPEETRDYVPRLVAATILAEQPHDYGFAPSRAKPYEFDRVFVPGGTYLSRVASALGVPPTVIRDLNPHLTWQVTPPGEIYPVRVPVGGSPQVVAALAAGQDTRRVAD
jgi:membrane-bound lytic murein transglycosylase D